MATPAQAAAATVGAGSLAAAGAYGITQAVNGSGEEQTTEEQVEETPTPTTFASTDLTTYTNKTLSFLKDDHLTKLVKAVDANDKWWEWAFSNRFNNRTNLTLESTFSTVTDSTSLKNSCNNAYGKDKTYFNTDNFLENIGAFCTSEKLSTLEPKAQVYQTSQKSISNYKNGVLSMTSNAAILVKKEQETNNDLWWKWAYKNFFKNSTSEVNDLFKKETVTTGFSSSANNSLNHACDEAYKKPYSDLKADQNKLLKNIKEFCSTDRTNTTLQFPEPANPTNVATGTEGMIKETENQNKLVDADNTSNNDWWDWMFANVYSTHDKTTSPLEDPFKHVTAARGSEDATSDTVTSLNKACKYAYTKKNKAAFETPDSQSNKLLEQVKKFCSANSSATGLIAPKT